MEVFIRALLIHLGYATYEMLPHYAFSNAAYIKILSDGVDFFIETVKGIQNYSSDTAEKSRSNP